MKLDLLDIYSDYLISQNHYATSTGLANMFQGEISHDQMTRHLRSKLTLRSSHGLIFKNAYILSVVL
jgi:hypothetical protein